MKNGTLVLFGSRRTDMECNCLEFFIFISVCTYTGLDKKNVQHKIVNIFLPITFTICFGCSKESSH